MIQAEAHQASHATPRQPASPARQPAAAAAAGLRRGAQPATTHAAATAASEVMMGRWRCAMTLTFGECAENHAGNQQLGALGAAGSGFSEEELRAAAAHLERSGGCQPELVALGHGAFVLILRGGVSAFGIDADALYAEHDALDVDKKAFMYGRVVTKHARHNLCYDDLDQAACYERGEGTVVAFPRVPLLERLRAALPELIGSPKAASLKCELNKYYNPASCGIGFHGDGERRRVIAVRLGVSIPLHFQWYQRHKPVGKRFKLKLAHGDMYIMSEKATGWDWKRSSMLTLRHAAGCAVFTEKPGTYAKAAADIGGVQHTLVFKKNKKRRDVAMRQKRVPLAPSNTADAVARELRSLLQSETQVDAAAIMSALARVEREGELDIDTLRRTEIAKVVKPLRQHADRNVSAKAACLYATWKSYAKSRGLPKAGPTDGKAAAYR
jgi:alkylated DNA repair dioxygenase AlkB